MWGLCQLGQPSTGSLSWPWCTWLSLAKCSGQEGGLPEERQSTASDPEGPGRGQAWGRLGAEGLAFGSAPLGLSLQLLLRPGSSPALQASSSLPGLFSWHPVLMSLAVSSGPGQLVGVGGSTGRGGGPSGLLMVTYIWGDSVECWSLPVAHRSQTGTRLLKTQGKWVGLV